jgi:hypothetical protein
VTSKVGTPEFDAECEAVEKAVMGAARKMLDALLPLPGPQRWVAMQVALASLATWQGVQPDGSRRAPGDCVTHLAGAARHMLAYHSEMTLPLERR